MKTLHVTIEDLNAALEGIIDMAHPPVRTELEHIKIVTDAIRAAHPDLVVTIDVPDGGGGIPIIIKKCNPLPLA